jgi:uncharacterized membrane protein
MVSEYDMMWFIINWNWICHEYPQIFMVIGCFSLIFGCCLGAFLLADITTGIIVSSLGFTAILLVVPAWLYMLKHNKDKQEETVKKFQHLLAEKGKQK